MPLAVTGYEVSVLQLAIHQYLTLPALVVILATGFYQVADVDFDLGGFWLSGTLTIVVVLGGMLGGFASLLVFVAVYLMVTKPGL
jgi:hypothetical protein